MPDMAYTCSQLILHKTHNGHEKSETCGKTVCLWERRCGHICCLVQFEITLEKDWRGGTPGEKAPKETDVLCHPSDLFFLLAKCTLLLIQVILMEQKMYTSGAALQLCLCYAVLLSFSEPGFRVKLLRFSQLRRVQWQQQDLCFILQHGILSVLCKTILRRPGFCKFLKQLERVFFNLSAND